MTADRAPTLDQRAGPTPGSTCGPAHAKLAHRTLENARVEAFRHPLVAGPPDGFRGGLVLTDAAEDLALRHSRYHSPVDSFDPDAAFSAVLPGEFIYAGPAYHHFGHVMAEMVHRIVPSRQLFDCEDWLFVGAIGGKSISGFAELPDFFKQILQFLRISPDRVTVLGENRIVAKLHVAEQGSDFGGGPKPGYLADLREFSQRRLDELHRGDPVYPLVYVSRSRIAQGGNFLGEAYVEHLLAEQGFVVFHPEEHPVSVQMNVYRNADILVFPEGSACHGVELLGEGMLKRCYFLVRREDHRDIFMKILSPRAATAAAFCGSPALGTLVVHPVTGVAYHHMGVSIFDLDGLEAFFRDHDIVDLSIDRCRYLEAAEADLLRYFRHHHENPMFPPPPDPSRLAELLASLRHRLAT